MVNENTNFFKFVDNFSKYKTIESELLEGKKNGKKAPLITIAIPTYKRPELLKKALDSAVNQLEFDDYEIIIVDNDDFQKKNETQILIESYKKDNMFYYKNKMNIGMFGNWNRCIELSRGKYITILNDDDWLENNFLKEMTIELEGKKAIYTDYKTVDFRDDKKNKSIALKKIVYNFFKVSKITLFDMFLENKSAGSLGIIFERDALISLGGYNENFFPSSDYYYHSFYIKKYGAKQVLKTLACYRIHENESAKLENLKKWSTLDELLHKEISKFLNINSKMLEFLINETTKERKNFLIDQWDYNIEKSRVSLLYRILKKIYKIYFYVFK